MNKKNIYILLFIITSFTLFAQNYETVTIRMKKDTAAWLSSLSIGKDEKGDQSFYESTLVGGYKGPIIITLSGTDTSISITNIVYNNTRYRVRTLDLIPAETECLLPEEWITDVSDPNRKVWTNAYYVDVLASQDRDRMLKYQGDYLQKMINSVGEGNPTWLYVYQTRSDLHESVWIYQSSISMGYHYPISFFIKNISPFNDGFKITVQGDDYFKSNYKYEEGFIDYFDRPCPEGTFNLILIRDGDYLDVYLENMGNHFATFILVKQNFQDQLFNLIHTESCDLTNITWPTRADGSMDYPVQSSILLKNFHPTHQTTTNLRLRSTANTDGNIITTLSVDTGVVLLEKGKAETIDGIENIWMKVLTADGAEGWCFGGYLENLRPPEKPIPVIKTPKLPETTPEPEPTPKVVEPQEEQNTGTLFYAKSKNDCKLLLAGIVCGIVLLAAVILVIVMKKKKRIN